MKLYKGLTFIYLFLSFAPRGSVEAQSDGGKKIVCYYTNWSIWSTGEGRFQVDDIDPFLCTHLLYAFVVVDLENLTILPFDPYVDIEMNNFRKFTSLKSKNPEVKTMLSIGGWNAGSANFSAVSSTVANREKFAFNVVQFLRDYDFDGLDVMWLYPAFREGGQPEDKENFGFLLEELKEEFIREAEETNRERLILSVAFKPLEDYLEKSFDVGTLNKHVDFMNLLTYAYHPSSSPTVNHHAALYPLRNEIDDPIASKLNVDRTVRNILEAGGNPELLVMAIPTFGRFYTLVDPEETDIDSPAKGGAIGTTTEERGELNYYEACGLVKSWTVKRVNETAMGPYAYYDDLWLGYDDEKSVKVKAEYAKMKNLGGLMFWTMDGDDFKGNCHGKTYPLIRSARQAFLTPPSPVMKPSQKSMPSFSIPATKAQSNEIENQSPRTVVEQPTVSMGAIGDALDFLKGIFTILVKNSTLNQEIHITNIFNFHNRTIG